MADRHSSPFPEWTGRRSTKARRDRIERAIEANYFSRRLGMTKEEAAQLIKRSRDN
ncbi:MAG: hypothetical protein ACTHKQ_13470 [Mesorhizobium sp.]